MNFDTIWEHSSPVVEMLLILIGGRILMHYLLKIMGRSMEHIEIDPSLSRFLKKAVKIAGYIVIITCALTALGISTGGIVAALSGCALAVGVALKDSLSNVAGGILLLLVPRFATGDYIEAGGDEGTVVSVDLLHTTIQTPDSKQVSIPNGTLMNGHITNYTTAQKRRVDIDFPISHDSDSSAALRIAMDSILAHPLTLKEPAEPFVRVTSYSENAVNVTVRVWCETAQYWNLKLDLLEQIRTAFNQNGISLACSRVDVRIQEK